MSRSAVPRLTLRRPHRAYSLSTILLQSPPVRPPGPFDLITLLETANLSARISAMLNAGLAALLAALSILLTLNLSNPIFFFFSVTS